MKIPLKFKRQFAICDITCPFLGRPPVWKPNSIGQAIQVGPDHPEIGLGLHEWENREVSNLRQNPVDIRSTATTIYESNHTRHAIQPVNDVTERLRVTAVECCITPRLWWQDLSSRIC